MLSKVTNAVSTFLQSETFDRIDRFYNGLTAALVAGNFFKSLCNAEVVDPKEHLYDVSVHTVNAITSNRSSNNWKAVSFGMNIGRMVAIILHQKYKDTTIRPNILNYIDFGNHVVTLIRLLAVGGIAARIICKRKAKPA